MRMCKNCILVLSELYLSLTRFMQLSTKTSEIHQLLKHSRGSDCTLHEDVNIIPDDGISPYPTVMKQEREEDETDGRNQDAEWIVPDGYANNSDTDDEGDCTDVKDEDLGIGSRLLRNRIIPKSPNPKKSSAKHKVPKRTTVTKEKESTRSRSSKKCVHCATKFQSAQAFQLHGKSCKGFVQKPFDCSICSPVRRFRLESHLTLHQTLTHNGRGENSAGPFPCSVGECKEIHKSGKGFVKHLKLVHGRTAKFDCTMCTRSFSVHRSLEAHMKTVHIGLTIAEHEKYKCRVCSTG